MVPGTVQLNIFTWNVRLARYVQGGQYEKTIEVFQQIQREGMNPDRFTFTAVLNACARLRALAEGRQIHDLITKSACESDVCVGSTLVDMYAKCGCMDDAWSVFNKMPTHDIFAWTAVMYGYVKCGQGQKALEIFRQMEEEGVEPDSVSFVGLVSACASIAALEEGRHVHRQIIQKGFDSDIVVGSCLVDMYAKCGSIEDAWRVFDNMPTRNVVSWNAMILGYGKCHQGQKALELYRQMNVKPNHVTFMGILNACGSVGALEAGRDIHRQIIQRSCLSEISLCNSLLDMYLKCRSIEDAWGVFSNMGSRNIVSWNVMILGHLKLGQGENALELYREMLLEGVEPDSITFVGVLNACASLAAIEEGRSLHTQIIQRACEADISVSTSLVDMYAKCGSIDDARRVFNKMPTRSVVSWTAMILGCANCGQGQEALQLFRQMSLEKVEPDAYTFVGVLNACATMAALEEGRYIHTQISLKGWDCDVFVANSLVDMYAKCGSIEDAQRVFNKMPVRNVLSWAAMLGGYAVHGYVIDALRHTECMLQEGLEMDRITFVSLLSACSHGGLVDEGLQWFASMSSVYNISSTIEHYACMVDLLGRAGRLHEGEDVMKRMPCQPDATVSTSLLGACRVHGNLEMAELIAKRALELDSGNASVHVLLSNIYGAEGS